MQSRSEEVTYCCMSFEKKPMKEIVEDLEDAKLKKTKRFCFGQHYQYWWKQKMAATD